MFGRQSCSSDDAMRGGGSSGGGELNMAAKGAKGDVAVAPEAAVESGEAASDPPPNGDA